MKVLKNVADVRRSLLKHRISKQAIGLVPTMGALHEGHLSLVSGALRHNDVTVATIFVNPIQFNKTEDLEKYPSSVNEDLRAFEKLGVDYVFMPSREEMYPKEPIISLAFGHLDLVMEGKHRPGHFNGVAIVVAKLLSIIAPTRAYFGQKDLQQFKIIEQLVNDLTIDVELVMMPIIREPNGLAMSSRNQRLSADGRSLGGQIYKNLSAAAMELKAGEEKTSVISKARQAISSIPEITIEYLELAVLEDLQISTTDTDINRLVLCFAGYLEGVRLIDNVIVGEN